MNPHEKALLFFSIWKLQIAPTPVMTLSTQDLERANSTASVNECSMQTIPFHPTGPSLGPKLLFYSFIMYFYVFLLL